MMKKVIIKIIGTLLIFLLMIYCTNQTNKRLTKISFSNTFEKIILNDIKQVKNYNPNAFSKKKLVLMTTKTKEGQNMFTFYDVENYIVNEFNYFGYIELQDYIVFYRKVESSIGLDKKVMALTSEKRDFNSVRIPPKKEDIPIPIDYLELSYIVHNDSIFSYNNKWDIVYRGNL